MLTGNASKHPRAACTNRQQRAGLSIPPKTTSKIIKFPSRPIVIHHVLLCEMFGQRGLAHTNGPPLGFPKRLPKEECFAPHRKSYNFRHARLDSFIFAVRNVRLKWLCAHKRRTPWIQQTPPQRRVLRTILQLVALSALAERGVRSTLPKTTWKS